MTSEIDRDRLVDVLRAEEERFVAGHPRSREPFEQGRQSLLAGVPMPWMTEWGDAFPVFVAEAEGDANRFTIQLARAITNRPKILVYAWCYHGTVDETFAIAVDGETRSRPDNVGPPVDLAVTTICAGPGGYTRAHGLEPDFVTLGKPIATRAFGQALDALFD